MTSLLFVVFVFSDVFSVTCSDRFGGAQACTCIQKVLSTESVSSVRQNFLTENCDSDSCIIFFDSRTFWKREKVFVFQDSYGTFRFYDTKNL